MDPPWTVDGRPLTRCGLCMKVDIDFYLFYYAKQGRSGDRQRRSAFEMASPWPPTMSIRLNLKTKVLVKHKVKLFYLQVKFYFVRYERLLCWKLLAFADRSISRKGFLRTFY